MAKPLELTEMERAALAVVVKREILRLQRIDGEADYDALGYRHGAREVLSDVEVKLRLAREPDTQAGELK